MKRMVSRTAIFIASSRFGLRPITIQWVGVSPRGHVIFMSLRTMNWNLPRSPVSMAARSTSPWPWAAWASDRKQRAQCIDRHEQRGAGGQVLVVEIAGVDAGRRRADTAHGRQRRDPHDAEKWPRHRHHNPRRHSGGLGLSIDRDDAPEDA